MSDRTYIAGKSIVVTGAASGFGKLICEKAAACGAKLICADINADTLDATVAEITASGGIAQAWVANVTDAREMAALAKAAVAAYGRIDVMINNAGVMPLAFFSDHEAALDKWHACIDINVKGVLNGMVAVYDQMIAQGSGHIINISSIYGNSPVAGAAVYGASKAAVHFLSESMRMESRGKIKVTLVRPTGVPLTGLLGSIVNLHACVGGVGQNASEYGADIRALNAGTLDKSKSNPEDIRYAVLAPGYVADQVIHAINQPDGVSISDICIRAAGDHYIL